MGTHFRERGRDPKAAEFPKTNCTTEPEGAGPQVSQIPKAVVATPIPFSDFTFYVQVRWVREQPMSG